MDLGSGIAIAGVAVSLLGGFKIAWPTPKSNGNGNGASSIKVCSLHSGVDAKLQVICEQQEEMRADIKTLLSRANHIVGI